MHHLFIFDLINMRDALATGCDFPYRYTRLHNESWSEQGGVLQTGCAHVTMRIWYIEHIEWLSHKPVHREWLLVGEIHEQLLPTCNCKMCRNLHL